MGYAIDRFSEVRAGYEIGYLNANLKLGTPVFSSVKGQVGAARFRFITDHLDEPVVPFYGYFGQMDFHWMDKSPGAPSAFPNLEMKAEFFNAISGRVSVFLLATGGTTMGYEQTGIPQYFLGGSRGCLPMARMSARKSVFPVPTGIHPPNIHPPVVPRTGASTAWHCMR